MAGGPAFAQNEQEQQTQTQNQQNNEQQNQQQAEATTAGSGECFEQLTAFSQRLRDEQFWVTGWGTPYTAPVATDGTMATTPWSGVRGVEPLQSPRTQIRELYGAAQVLAYRGETEGCEYLVGVLSNTYEEYVDTLTEAGVEPQEITSWRSEQIALSEPVTEMQQVGRVNVDELTGTDVRNTNDQNLGSVSDIVIDPQSGQIAYAIVARGGFLGVGEDHVAVPWERFRATPGLNTLVLDVTEQELAQAPTIDPGAFSNPGQLEQQNQQIDEYWSS
ncbi:hypothetical protein GCM10010862_25900 [Devosia nitrariae]|uniref:PRC-barrel domain-containing protein n=1 Tax=Devosia nitrariae TaxID=2071872 RepID=A0ABQ5W6B2_9HYPH|nr:hypothetical protein GCM10010862_25900 [Devosia nitrariae]